MDSDQRKFSVFQADFRLTEANVYNSAQYTPCFAVSNSAPAHRGFDKIRAEAALFRANHCDGRSVLEGCAAGLPATALRPAAQRFHREPHLVSGFERLARPAIPVKAVGAIAFESPDHGLLTLAPNFKDDQRMRADELELTDNADQFDRVFPVVNHERVMARCRDVNRDDNPDPGDQRCKTRSQWICLIDRNPASSWSGRPA
jgi:hypothetical protein